MQLATLSTFVGRYVGLIGSAGLNAESAVYISECRQIHTWFMRFAIDAVFVNEDGVVLEIFPSVAPWRVTKKVLGATGCLELAAGEAERKGIVVGRKCLIDAY